MNPKAIEAARDQVRYAKRALAILEAIYATKQPSSYPKELARQWADVLEAYYTVYAKLDAGSKQYGKSKPWFGRKIKERRSDPLLTYVYQARHTEKHGLEYTALYQPIGLSVIGITNPETGEVTGSSNPPSFTVRLPGTYLRPVTDDRFNDTFDPPRTHLEKPFNSQRPLEVARAAVAYIEKLVNQAAELVE